MLPVEVSADTVRHLLSVRLIRQLDTTSATTLGPGLVDLDEGGGEQGEEWEPTPAETGDDEARAAARAALPADGAMPAGNAAQAVWVEYLVGRGYDYAAVSKASRTELVKLAKTLGA